MELRVAVQPEKALLCPWLFQEWLVHPGDSAPVNLEAFALGLVKFLALLQFGEFPIQVNIQVPTDEATDLLGVLDKVLECRRRRCYSERLRLKRNNRCTRRCAFGLSASS